MLRHQRDDIHPDIRSEQWMKQFHLRGIFRREQEIAIVRLCRDRLRRNDLKLLTWNSISMLSHVHN